MILLAKIAVEAVKYIRSISCGVPLTLSPNSITRSTEVSFPGIVIIDASEGTMCAWNKRAWNEYLRIN